MTPSETPDPNKRRDGREKSGRLPLEDWARIKSLICAGRPMSEVAEAYGVTIGTISARSNREQWPTPTRERLRKLSLERKRNLGEPKSPENPSAGSQENPEKVTPETTDEAKTTHNALIPKLARDLATLAQTEPEAFEEAAGRFAQAMVAEGLRTAEPPRTVRELQAWEDLRRKYLKRDAKETAGNLLDPVRPVRRGRVVDATTADTVDTDQTAPGGNEGDEDFEV